MSKKVSPSMNNQQDVVGFYNGKQVWYTSSTDLGSPSSGKNKNGHIVDIDKSIDRRSNGGSTITAHDIKYEVLVKSRPCCGKSSKKEILKGIEIFRQQDPELCPCHYGKGYFHALTFETSTDQNDICGVFPPGMNAILGPTGSGKSSFLDVLSGRKDPKGLTGDLLLDGSPPPENFKCMVGYVVQDDVVMGTLTVRENFEFSATLRLPSSVSKQERKKRVDSVIHELGLHHCANSKVGNEFIRGVSGGERKRTNIGMELIISPPVLFLDEPTTGLDSNTANSVMLLLKRLTLKGKTIIFSIHQPRYSIFRLFDNMLLLSHGETVYHGPANQALEHFNNIGYHIEEHNNPPDFFLDVINGDKLTLMSENAIKQNGVIGSNRSLSPIVDADLLTDYVEELEHENEEESLQNTLVDGYKRSQFNKRLQKAMQAIMDEYQNKKRAGMVPKQKKIDYATGFMTQFGALSIRILRNMTRNPMATLAQSVISIVFALIVGIVYYQLASDCISGIQNRIGAFFFIVMNLIFSNLSAIELFIKQRVIFLHETVSGFYRISVYFCAFVFCDLLPNRMIPTTVYAVIVYFMIGLQLDVGKFFFFLLSLYCVSLCAAGIAYFYSSAIGNFSIANLFIALTFVVMMVFGGLLINTDSIADWLSWIKWISIFKYGLSALSINELKDFNFYNGSGILCSANGNDYFVSQGIDYKTTFDLWVNIMALGIMAVVFLTLTFISLLRAKTLK